jgi:peptidoglycan/xylan/chitin deacetylase (PgdA/CDA1 family)
MTPRLPLAVMWHYVRGPEATPRTGYRGVDPHTFRRQLDALARDATPVGWSDIQAAWAGDRRLPHDAVLLTFDDGLIDHHRVVLPALVERGLTATFFVLARHRGDGLTLGHRIHVLLGVAPSTEIRQAIEDRLAPPDRARYDALRSDLTPTGLDDPDDLWKRPLQRELADVAGPVLTRLIEERIGPEAEVADTLHLGPGHLADLTAAGMTIGGHTRHHPWLDGLERAAVRAEVAESAEHLRAIAPGPWPFAYPYGGVPRGADTILASAGFGAAFTTVADDRSDRFHIGRRDADDQAWTAWRWGASGGGSA